MAILHFGEAGQNFPPEAQFLTMELFREINPDIVSKLDNIFCKNNVMMFYISIFEATTLSVIPARVRCSLIILY